jgi:pyrroline-5-carboxylate reductase
LGGKARVVRAMPNMPALIGEGITGICAGLHAKSVDLKLAQSIIGAIGQTVILKESMMDALTAVSGSGPAYVFLFVEEWIRVAIKLGFNGTDARRLVYKTLLGSAHLLEQSPFDAAQLRAKVTSKGGTTEAAMKVFFKGNKFSKLMENALIAAMKRAKGLSK